MSYQDLAALLQQGGNVVIIANGPVNLSFNVDRAPNPVAFNDLPKEKEAVDPSGHPQVIDLAQGANPEDPEAELPLDDAMRRKLADVTADAKALDAGPSPEERFWVAIMDTSPVKGNLTRDKLIEAVGPHNKALAVRLWKVLVSARFRKFLAEYGIELQEGRRGGYLMSSLQKVVTLEELVPGCVSDYDAELDGMLRATVAKR